MTAPGGLKGQARGWLKVTVHHPAAAAEAVSEVFFRLGAQAVWEDRPDAEGRLVSRSGFALGLEESLRPPLAANLARIAEIFETSPLEPLFEAETGADWAEKWKEGLEPVIIRDALAIKPTWWTGPLAGNPPLTLELDPGLAFGTGHHATTYMCLWALLELAGPTVNRILDLGAGSGILALSAALMTASQEPRPEIFGLDNDPDTLPTALENAALNGLEGRASFVLKPEALSGRSFDLVLANITLGPLLALKEFVARVTGPEAWLILSGLLPGQVPEAVSAYQALGFQNLKLLRRDEWAALVLRKNPAGPAPAAAPATEVWV